MQDNFELVVIGSGPAGRRAAVQAAKLGRSVLVIEKDRRVGGVCVHTGTIPSKTLRETVLNLSGFRERGFYGAGYRARHDIVAADLTERLGKTLGFEVDVLEHQFTRNRVETLHGAARFEGPHEIDVLMSAGETRRIHADKVLIAVGTVTRRPEGVPFDGTIVLDSDDIVHLDHLPRSLTVVGAGVIGVEYATIFSALDVKVTLVEGRSTFLDFIDREIIEELVHELRDRGVALRTGSKVDTVSVEDGRAVVHLDGGRIVRSEMLLYAGGRTVAADGLGLEVVGIELDARGRVPVDAATLQTRVPNIYAAGDAIGFPSLASTSLEQGRIAACHAFGLKLPPAPKFFPYGIYSVPEISTVGMTEEQVREQRIPYECGIARLRETSRGHIMGLRGGMMKMIFGTGDRRLLGVHIIGEGATELVHIGQAVLNLHGTIDYFIENTFNYPTLAEAYKIAALDAFNRM
jgi:NAD(P) transhydrogenase